MKNQNLLDQFFLKDEEIIGLLVETLAIKKKDIIFEIGAGSGIITREITKKAGKVIAVEIDKTFAKDLKQIPGNIKLIFADALKVLKDRKKYSLKFNKIIGSLPSSIVEPLIPVLIGADFKMAVFLIPLKFAYKLINQPVFTAYFERQRESSSAYFDIMIIKKVSRKSFCPIPKTNWALIRIIKKPDPLKTGERARFLRQYVCNHPKAETKNALVEGLITFYRAQGKSLTKKQAKTLVVTQNPL